MWVEEFKEIHVQLMGQVQMEVLVRLIKDRFGVVVTFGPGSIVYKETIARAVEGVGHFEPLRHYAEVHLLCRRRSVAAESRLHPPAVRMCSTKLAAPHSHTR